MHDSEIVLVNGVIMEKRNVTDVCGDFIPENGLFILVVVCSSEHF